MKDFSYRKRGALPASRQIIRDDVIMDAVLSVPALLCLFGAAYLWLILGSALVGG